MKYILIAPINLLILIFFFGVLLFLEIWSLIWHFKRYEKNYNDLKWKDLKEIDYNSFFTESIIKNY